MRIEDVIPGQQYMVRKHADSRRVRVEVASIVSYDDIRTVFVHGRHIRQGRRIKESTGHPTQRIIIGERRVWSTYPELIEPVEPI